MNSATFRKLADAMQATIDDKRRPLTQNPTPKRMFEYRSRLHAGENMVRTQAALRILADLNDAGNLPAVLAGLKGKSDVALLVRKGLLGGGYYDVNPSPDYADKSLAGKLLQRMIDAAPSVETKSDRQLKLEKLDAHVQFSNIPGYFPTPDELADRLIGYAELFPGCSVLEPSAGKGNLVDAVLRACPTAKVDAIEPVSSLQEILTLKGISIVGSRFEEFGFGRRYDRIVMNPPFEKGLDIEHVRLALTYLKPDGILAAIVSSGAMFRSDKKAVAFQSLLSSHATHIEKVDAGSFQESGTGVGASIVVLPAVPMAVAV